MIFIFLMINYVMDDMTTTMKPIISGVKAYIHDITPI